MFHLGEPERRKTLARFVAAAETIVGADAPNDYKSLCRTLSGLQSGSIAFEGDEAVSRCLARDGLSDLSRYGTPLTLDERVHWATAIEAALTTADSQYTRFGALIDDIVAVNVILPGPGNGGCSISSLPGIVFVNPSSEWPLTRLIECLIHEATHLGLFLVDMFHNLYAVDRDRYGDADHLLLSAVRRGQKRPVDAALHAAVVAAMILAFHRRTGDPAFERDYGDSFSAAVSDIDSRRDLFTVTGQDIVDDLIQFAENRELEVL